MKKYEAMFIIKPDLKDEEKNAVMKNVKEQITRHQGSVISDQIWAERKKLAFDLFPKGGQARFKEGLYYHINFSADPSSLAAIKNNYGLNENILRYMILKTQDHKST